RPRPVWAGTIPVPAAAGRSSRNATDGRREIEGSGSAIGELWPRQQGSATQLTSEVVNRLPVEQQNTVPQLDRRTRVALSLSKKRVRLPILLPRDRAAAMPAPVRSACRARSYATRTAQQSLNPRPSGADVSTTSPNELTRTPAPASSLTVRSRTGSRRLRWSR